MLPPRLLLCCLFALSAHADSLYQRLGGEAGVAAITGELIELTVNDPAINASFSPKTDLKRVKRLVSELLCERTGGPCHYSGDDMRQVHAGLGVREGDFYGMVSHLRQVLDARGVAQADKNALLALLAPMKRDVVEEKK